MFLAGRDDSIDAMASRLGVRRDYVAVLVRLSYLSPEIVGAILVGRQPVELTPTRLVMLSRNVRTIGRSSGGSSDLRLPDAAPTPLQCSTSDEVENGHKRPGGRSQPTDTDAEPAAATEQKPAA